VLKDAVWKKKKKSIEKGHKNHTSQAIKPVTRVMRSLKKQKKVNWRNESKALYKAKKKKHNHEA
jgi:hypothetical protein